MPMTDEDAMKGKTSLPAALLTLCLITSSARAQTLGDGIAAWSLQDFARARAIFESLAAKGDAEAAYRLGMLHESGLGETIDREKALYWYRRAGEGGHRAAQSRAAELALAVAGAADPDELEAAANSGSLSAMMTLVRAHASGEGAPLDPDAARHWLERLLAATENDGPEAIRAWAQSARAALDDKPAAR